MKRLLLAAAMVAACSVAHAQTPPRAPNLDTDHDGRVTLKEFQVGRQGEMLMRLDGDKDGRVSRAEFEVAIQRMKARGGADGGARAAVMWTVLDADKDGYVSKAEWEATQLRRFQVADTNNDGWLSKGEVLMMRQNRARGG